MWGGVGVGGGGEVMVMVKLKWCLKHEQPCCIRFNNKPNVCGL